MDYIYDIIIILVLLFAGVKELAGLQCLDKTETGRVQTEPVSTAASSTEWDWKCTAPQWCLEKMYAVWTPAFSRLCYSTPCGAAISSLSRGASLSSSVLLCDFCLHSLMLAW